MKKKDYKFEINRLKNILQDYKDNCSEFMKDIDNQQAGIIKRDQEITKLKSEIMDLKKTIRIMMEV